MIEDVYTDLRQGVRGGVKRGMRDLPKYNRRCVYRFALGGKGANIEQSIL